ncbi:UNVERIFIED_CONTAM: hypothetical protein FKN15_068304 [Acipenser sinensis]
MLLFVLLFGFFSVAQPDSHQVLGIVGESLRFPVEIPDLLPDEEINWRYGRDYPSWTLVRIRNGKIEDNYLERFQTRLQLDKMTGSLQISNLQMEDSGFYRVQKVKGIKYEQIFYLSVKHPVPEPQVMQIHSANRSCTLQCFVGNASEVNVSWMRDGKPLHTTELEISQEMQGGNVTYSCVASNKTTTVTPSHYCDEKGRRCGLIPVFPGLGRRCGLIPLFPGLGRRCGLILVFPGLGRRCGLIPVFTGLGRRCGLIPVFTGLGRRCGLIPVFPGLGRGCGLIPVFPGLERLWADPSIPWLGKALWADPIIPWLGKALWADPSIPWLGKALWADPSIPWLGKALWADPSIPWLGKALIPVFPGLGRRCGLIPVFPGLGRRCGLIPVFPGLGRR